MLEAMVYLLSIYHRQSSHQSPLNYMQVSFTCFQLHADLLQLSDPLRWFWRSALASQHVVLFEAEISLLVRLTPLLSDSILTLFISLVLLMVFLRAA